MAANTFNSFERLPESDDLWKQVLDSLAAEVAVVDGSGTIIAVNSAWARFAEANGGRSETTGVGVNYLDICRRANGSDALLAEQACRGIEDVLCGARDSFKLEYPCHSPTRERWFLLYVSPLEGMRHAVVTTHLSITERKLTEQRLVMTERLAAIGQAMEGLSHEGRKSLQRSQASIDLLRLHLGNDTDALELLERIERAQNKLLGVYEEVRSYAAPVSVRYETYPVDKIVDELLSTLRPHASTLQISHSRPAENLDCDIDVGRIRMVLELVLDNAVAASAGAYQVDVSYRADEVAGSPGITIIVSDDGRGIPTEDRDRVFEPFFTTKPNGTGLGLAICKRIVVAHGGRIGFDQPRLGGASICITLPKQRAAART